MAIYNFTQFLIDEVNYFIDFISDNIAEYKLSELTNGYCGDIPSIQDTHPLAMEYGNALLADDDGNYTSILPAIGVELIDDSRNPQQLMGAGRKPVIITQTFLDEITAISIQNRFKNGIIMSDSVLADIQAALTAKAGEKLYAIEYKYFRFQNVNISIWSDNIEVTRMLYSIVRSILGRSKLDLSAKGVKNLDLKGQNALYNYELGKTLFGAEFSLNFMNTYKNIQVDDSITELKQINHFIAGEANEKPTFVVLGEGG